MASGRSACGTLQSRMALEGACAGRTQESAACQLAQLPSPGGSSLGEHHHSKQRQLAQSEGRDEKGQRGCKQEGCANQQAPVPARKQLSVDKAPREQLQRGFEQLR